MTRTDQKSRMENRKKEIIKRLEKAYPKAKCTLDFENSTQLLVSTILSAQCTDTRVNIVTRELFKKYKTAGDFAKANLKTLEKEIKSTGFYRTKAKNIINSAKILVRRHGGTVPNTMEQLLELPGVARKTANVVMGAWFNKAEGIVVDTHVTRLSQRLGLTKNEDPTKIEKDLVEIVPKSKWINFSHLLIAHGRTVCNARKPRCNDCVLKDICPSAFKV